MRFAGTVGLLFGLVLLAAACAPKGTGGGTPTPPITPAGSPTPLPSQTPIQTEGTLLGLGLGGPRSLWNDPPIRPGERVAWVLTRDGLSERLDVSRLIDPQVPDHWKIAKGRKQEKTVEVLREGGAGAARLVMSMSGDVLGENAAMQQLLVSRAAIAGSGGETSFTAAGGSFIGNEVLRVPAGDFRARHAVITEDGQTWHLYLVRTVPGGIAKAEMIPEGTSDPTVIYELDDFTRIPRSEPAP